MKKILFLILFPIIIYAQTGKSVFTPRQTDTLRTFVDKTTAQTITGQKNFSGTVKVGSDTSMILGYMDGSLRTGLHINQLAGHPYGQNRIFKVVPLNPLNASWSLKTGIADFTTGGIYDHTVTLGYNSDNELTDLKFGQQMEATYDVNDTTLISEWFSYYNSTPTSIAYQVRPFQLATYRYGSSAPYRYTSTVSMSADLFSIVDETNASLIEFRTQTYGATATQSEKNKAGEYSNALGNSVMLIQDSLWISHLVNNFGWLYQADPNGSARELMRIDNTGTYGHLLIAPSTNNDIDFRSPIYGTIDWRNEDSTDVISIYKETGTNRIYVGGNDGMVTNKIEVINIPQDTTGLGQLQFYVDPLTGSVQYTMPEDIATNGSFTAWTGTGKSATPDGWVFAPDPRDTTAIYIEQSPTGKLHFVWDGSDRDTYVKQLTSTVGAMYGYSFVVSEITDTALVYVVGEGVRITTTGVYSGSFESVDNSKFQIVPEYGAGSITLDDMKLWEIGGNIDAPTYDVPVILDSLGLAVAPVIDTTGVTDGYVLKYIGGQIVYSPDISTSGSGTFNPDGVTIDTTAGGLARVFPTKVTKWDSVTVKLNASDTTSLSNRINLKLTATDTASLSNRINLKLTATDTTSLSNRINLKLNTSDTTALRTFSDLKYLENGDSTNMRTFSDAKYATKLEVYDTLAISWGMMDTVLTGDVSGWKVPNNITITEIAAYTNTGTVTFNIEERAETTPNTAGVDLIGSDLVADTDQQKTSTFSNSAIDRDDWLVPTITSIGGDPTIFSITIRYIKTN